LNKKKLHSGNPVFRKKVASLSEKKETSRQNMGEETAGRSMR